MEYFNNNIRYILAIMTIVTVLLIDKNFFINYEIKSADCANEKCPQVMKKSNLSDNSPAYYVDRVLNGKKGGFYRIIFWEKSNISSNISLELINISEEKIKIDNFEIDKSSHDFYYHEAFFAADDGFSDLIFKKTNPLDGAEIEIRNIILTKLNVGQEREINYLQPTIIGRTDNNTESVRQVNSNKKFDQLHMKDVVLGQVFKADSDYLSAVSFDIDITRNDNRGGRKYQLQLRQADFDGQVYAVKSDIVASLNFTPEDIEIYRQADGKMKFPLSSILKKGQYYFIGIDNERIVPDKFNHLTLHGSSNDKYEDGSAILKKRGEVYQADGDLYFIIYGSDFMKVDNQRLLSEAIIEDLGRGKGRYLYRTSGKEDNLVDLDDFSGDIKYDEKNKSIYGTAEEGSYFIYVFNTIHPFQKLNFKIVYPGKDWTRCKLSYSFDKVNWQDVSGNLSEKNEEQQFGWEILGGGSEKAVYVKITPEEIDSKKTDNYGIKALEVVGDLNIRSSL